MRRVIELFVEANSIRESEADTMVPMRDSYFWDGMSILSSLCRESREAESFSEWAGFRERIVALIRSNGWAFHNYIETTADKARGSGADGWASWSAACELRSAVQFVLDELGGPALFYAGGYDVELLEEADESFREQASWVAPGPGYRPPAGTPDSHWWWLLPRFP